MPLEINAQFNKFVQFAQRQTDGNAIARTAPAGEGPLAGRAVAVAAGNKADGFKHPGTYGDRNDAARTLFRQSVAAIFGREENIPDSVKAAMKLEDDGKGKPLTARHILTVQKAILRVKAEEAVDRAVECIDAMLLSLGNGNHSFGSLGLTAAQRTDAAGITAKFGRNLTGKGLRLLACHATIAVARGSSPHAVSRDLQKVFAPFRDTRQEEERSGEIDRKMLDLAREQLAGYLSRNQDGTSDGDDPEAVLANARIWQDLEA